VALTLTDFELWTVTAPGLVTAGLVADTVFVRVFVVVVVRVVVVSACDVAVVRVPGSDFAGAVTLLACAAAFETF
jgi:hypothetical protein